MEEQRHKTESAVEYYAKAFTINRSLLDVRVNPRILDTKLVPLRPSAGLSERARAREHDVPADAAGIRTGDCRARAIAAGACDRDRYAVGAADESGAAATAAKAAAVEFAALCQTTSTKKSPNPS